MGIRIPKLQLLLLSLRDLRDKTLSLLRTSLAIESTSMDVGQSSPRSDLLPHHSDKGEWEFPIEDIQFSEEGVSAAFPHRKVSATTTMSAVAEHLFHQGIDMVNAVKS
jgi:hypothetical protein